MSKKRSNKIAQKVAKKRAERALRKNGPKKSTNRFVPARSDKFMKKLDRLHDAMVRNGLENPTEYLKNGGKVGQLKEFDHKGLIKDVKERIGDSFKLFAYVTMAQALVEAKVFEHEFKVDLKEIALQLTSMDKTFQGLNVAAERSKEDFAIEIFDLAGELEDASSKLYAEVENLTPHEPTMGKHLTHHAKLLMAEEPGKSEGEAHKEVLEAVAYAYLHKVTKEAQ